MKLNQHDLQRLLDFYQQALEIYGHQDARSVRWSRPEDQIIRFEVLTTVGDLDSRSVLDVGCGLGELYAYLIRSGYNLAYTGIDIVPDFIQVALQRFPDGQFQVQDIFDVTDRYDYVLASGALSFKVANHQDYYRQMMQQLYQRCQLATAFNLLDRAVHIDDDIFCTYDPAEVAEFCSTFAHRVEIQSGYLPQDFTVMLYRS